MPSQLRLSPREFNQNGNSNENPHTNRELLPIEQPESWEHADAQQTLEFWRKVVQLSKHDTFLLLDIDDTLVEGLLIWLEEFSKVLGMLSVDQILEQWVKPFAKIKEILGDELFAEHEARLRNDERVNTSGKIVDDRIHEFLESILDQHAVLLGGLTARQDVEATRQQTWKKLKSEDVGLLEGYPIMFRPHDIEYEHSAFSWKPDILLELAEQRAGVTPILVDDSCTTANGVGKKNQLNPEKPIVQILLRTRINFREVDEMIQVGLPPGVFVAENWEDVPNQIAEARSWANQQRANVVLR